MKNILVFILLLGFVHPGSCQTDTLNSGPTPYDIKSGKIVYRFFNGIQQGEKTVVFDDYGRYEKMIGSSIVASSATEDQGFVGDTIREMLIKKEGVLYKIDLNKGIGFKLSRTDILPLNLNSLRPGQMITGTDTVLGKECTIVEVFGSLRSWYWNRIPIRKQIIGSGMTLKVEEFAISIEEDYTIRESEFELPIGISLK